jgi:hypothetical protein
VQLLPCNKHFYSLALSLSCAWLVVILPCLTFSDWEHDEQRRAVSDTDFAQYYMGALVVRHALWDNLYPVPKEPVSQEQPSPLRIMDGGIASAEQSTIDPKLLTICPELEGNNRYVYPPPLALLLAPLGFLDYHGAKQAWFLLLGASLCGTGYLSYKIFAKLTGQVYKPTGILIIILPATIQLYCYLRHYDTGYDLGNCSAFLGLLITAAVWCWLAERQVLVGILMIPLLLFKGLGLGWCLLLLAMPVRWKTLATLAILTIGLNTLTFYFSGVQPYKVFLTEILPAANIAVGTGLQGQLKYYFGLNYQKVFLLVNLFLHLVVFVGYQRSQSLADHNGYRNEATITALACSVAIFVLLNPVVWQHYYFPYLVYPFAGLISIHLGRKSSKKNRSLLALFLLIYIGLNIALVNVLTGLTGASPEEVQALWNILKFFNGIFIPIAATVVFLTCLLIDLYARPSQAEPLPGPPDQAW